MSNLTADQRGVVRGGNTFIRTPAPKPPVTPPPTTWDEAYVLARANQHKPWARRWLKQRGYAL